MAQFGGFFATVIFVTLIAGLIATAVLQLRNRLRVSGVVQTFTSEQQLRWHQLRKRHKRWEMKFTIPLAVIVVAIYFVIGREAGLVGLGVCIPVLIIGTFIVDYMGDARLLNEIGAGDYPDDFGAIVSRTRNTKRKLQIVVVILVVMLLIYVRALKAIQA